MGKGLALPCLFQAYYFPSTSICLATQKPSEPQSGVFMEAYVVDMTDKIIGHK